MMEVRRLGAKAPVSLRYSSLEEGDGVAKYATGHHIFIFMEIKGIKTFFQNPTFMFRHAPSEALGSYVPVNQWANLI